MKDLNEISPDNFREVTVPLQIDQIKEFFDNKELFFLVDYTQSKIKGNMFLTYISNMDLPCEILLDQTSKEEKFELLRIFMETRNLNNSNALRLAAAQVMLEFRGISTAEVFSRPALTKEECAEFISLNTETVTKWHQFILSSMVFFLTSVSAIEEEYNFKDSFKCVDDAQFIGNNIVQMFSIPSFLELYFSKAIDVELIYFKKQFEEYMFRGKNFFEFFAVPQNSLYQTFTGLLESNIDPAELVKLFKKE